ncbi:MAG: ABC transporter substrate-binding protein, partial [Xanthobacteraceae bacterium]
MKILRRTALAATMVGALALSAQTPASAAQMENASIALPALTIIFLPVYVAEDQGIWKNLGLNVTLHQITGIGSTNAMLAGSVDFAVQSGQSLIRGDIRGRHMLGIALMADGIDFELIASKQTAKKIDMAAPVEKRVAALKGMQISTDAPNTVIDGVLRYFVAKAGLNPTTDITTVYMQPSEAIAALQSGAVSASMLNFPWTETAQREAGGVLLASGATDLPELLPTAATTTTVRQGYCESHSSICAKLVHGFVLAHKFIHEHPHKALQIALKRMPKANLSDMQKSMALILKTTPLVPRYDAAAFNHAQQIMIVGGMMRKDEAR